MGCGRALATIYAGEKAHVGQALRYHTCRAARAIRAISAECILTITGVDAQNPRRPHIHGHTSLAPCSCAVLEGSCGIRCAARQALVVVERDGDPVLQHAFCNEKEEDKGQCGGSPLIAGQNRRTSSRGLSEDEGGQAPVGDYKSTSRPKLASSATARRTVRRILADHPSMCQGRRPRRQTSK